jgi:flagellar biosynthesis protein FlhB
MVFLKETMEEKKFAPSKSKLDRLYREGRYPFSLLLFRALTLGICWVFLLGMGPYLLKSLMDLMRQSFACQDLSDLSRLRWSALVWNLLFFWIVPVGLYFSVGGKLSFENKGDRDSWIEKFFSAGALVVIGLVFTYEAWVLIPFQKVGNVEGVLTVVKQKLWILVGVVTFLGALSGTLDYFIRRFVFLKNARMNEQEKKEEQKQ